jgi:hypothetical protein
MGIDELITQIGAIEAHVAAGEIVSAFEATIPIQQTIVDSLKKVGFKAARPVSNVQCEKLEKACKKLETSCQVQLSQKSADAVGKDGKILNALTELVKVIGPILLQIFVHV